MSRAFLFLLIAAVLVASIVGAVWYTSGIVPCYCDPPAPASSAYFLGPLNWNKPFGKTGTSLGQTTFIIRNLGDNLTIESISLIDGQGSVLQLVDTFNSTVSLSDSGPEQDLAFQVFTVAPDKGGTMIPRQSLNPGVNFLTVDFV